MPSQPEHNAAPHVPATLPNATKEDTANSIATAQPPAPDAQQAINSPTTANVQHGKTLQRGEDIKRKQTILKGTAAALITLLLAGMILFIILTMRGLFAGGSGNGTQASSAQTTSQNLNIVFSIQ